MVGLDLTYQARATQEVVDHIREVKTQSGVFLTEVLDAFNQRYRQVRGHNDAPVHDPCAVAYVIDPTVVEAQRVPIAVELTGTLTAGMTVAGFRRPSLEDCHTWAALKLDVPRFWDLVTDAVQRLS